MRRGGQTECKRGLFLTYTDKVTAKNRYEGIRKNKISLFVMPHKPIMIKVVVKKGKHTCPSYIDTRCWNGKLYPPIHHPTLYTIRIILYRR